MTDNNGMTDTCPETVDRLLEAGREKVVLKTDNMGQTALQYILFNQINPSRKLVERIIEVGGRS